MRKYVSGKIIIIKTPVGTALVSVRKKWVGLTLPIIATEKINSKVYYVVLQKESLIILSQKSQRAANWFWQRNFPQGPDACFAFQSDEVKVLGKLKKVQPEVRQFVGLLELGVGAGDNAVNQDQN